MRELIPFMSLMKETSGLFGLLTRDPVFFALSGNIMKSVLLLQRDQSLLQRQSILPSSIITFDVLLVMEQLSRIQLVPPNTLQTFSQIPFEKRSSATCGISLWDGYLFLEIHSSFTTTTVSGGV